MATMKRASSGTSVALWFAGGRTTTHLTSWLSCMNGMSTVESSNGQIRPYLPLQLLVSGMAQHLYNDRPDAFRPIAADQSTSDSEPCSTRYRVILLPPNTKHPHQTLTDIDSDEFCCRQPCDMSMDGLFDLGVQSTKALLRHRNIGLPNPRSLRHPSFAGSQEEFDGCLGLLVAEIRGR